MSGGGAQLIATTGSSAIKILAENWGTGFAGAIIRFIKGSYSVNYTEKRAYLDIVMCLDKIDLKNNTGESRTFMVICSSISSVNIANGSTAEVSTTRGRIAIIASLSQLN